MSDQHTLSFDRMRSMLMRAAEIRDSEQQQIFDSLDEIHARLATLDAVGSIRKRLSELPDRTEVSVLAERLDETIAKLDAQDATVTSVAQSVDGLVDRLAKPFAQLDGRLDGVAGRMEGVAGRMDGLDDKLAGLHKRLDDLDNRLDRHELRLDGMPAAVIGPMRERVGGLESELRVRIDEVDEGVRKSVDSSSHEVRDLVTQTGSGLHTKLSELGERPAVDPTSQLDGLGDRLATLSARLEELSGRLDGLDSTLGQRPDRDTVSSLVHQANEESERRNAGQLDEAMATFAELILGRGPSAHIAQKPMPAPRPAQRRGRIKSSVQPRNGTTPDEPDTEPEEN